MFLVVGLGNPGKEHENTYHNAGFLALDEIAADFQFPIFKFQSKQNAQISKNAIGDQEVILLKPQTFMNNSGISIKNAIKNLKLEIKNLIVIHDDIDLPLGKLRISQGSGSGGHKGVESIVQNLGTKDFIRVRVGIQPQKGKPESAETFVLKKIKKNEKEIMEKILKKTTEAIQCLLEEGLEKTMNEYN